MLKLTNKVRMDGNKEALLQLKKIHVAISCSINSNVPGYTTPIFICPEPTPELLKDDNYQIELLKQFVHGLQQIALKAKPIMHDRYKSVIEFLSKYTSQDENNLKYTNGFFELMNKTFESNNQLHWKSTIKYIDKQTFMQNADMILSKLIDWLNEMPVLVIMVVNMILT